MYNYFPNLAKLKKYFLCKGSLCLYTYLCVSYMLLVQHPEIYISMLLIGSYDVLIPICTFLCFDSLFHYPFI